jgi:hypothetical protein
MSVSRRAFISRGSVALALAGAMAALPGLGAILKPPRSALTDGAIQAVGQPLVAHVRNAATGEISFMVGTQKIVIRDTDLAARLFQAARAPLGGR